MTSIAKAKRFVEFVQDKLTAEDDASLWEVALAVLLDEFLLRYQREGRNRNWVFHVGACSRWVRPHQSRWTAAGGFAWPEGYRNSLPELDWSVLLSYQDPSARTLSGKRQVVFRVAIPTRSLRHKQVAVHTKWSTSQEPIVYGFRKLNSTSKWVAASDERSQGAIRPFVGGSRRYA